MLDAREKTLAPRDARVSYAPAMRGSSSRARRRLRAAAEEVLEEEDRIRDVREPIPVDVDRAGIIGARLSEEETGEEVDRVGDVDLAVPVRVPAPERLPDRNDPGLVAALSIIR